MKKFISIFLVLFFLVAMVPSVGFCEGANDAGLNSGGQILNGINNGTLALAAGITAAVAGGLAIALGGGGGGDAGSDSGSGSSSTSSHH